MSSVLDHPLYLNDGDSRDKKIVSFNTYMSRAGPIIDSFKVPSNYTDIKLDYSFVPELHRANLKTIIDFICDLLKQKLSLESFNESNIVFQRGQLKFCGLKIVKRLNYEDKERVLELLHDVIWDLINKYNYKRFDIPTPVNDLLSCIRFFRYLNLSSLSYFR